MTSWHDFKRSDDISPLNNNVKDFAAHLRKLAQQDSGRFSCLEKILSETLYDWRISSILEHRVQADDWVYRAIQSRYGWVNSYVEGEINDPAFNLPGLRPANRDPSKSKLACAFVNGGDGVRPGGTRSIHPDLISAPHTHNHMCATGAVYLRPGPNGGWCEAVDPADVSSLQSCGAAGLRYSEATPISLLWDPKLTLANFEKEIRLVKFALDLRDGSDSFYEWKASGEAPLLVYDPEATGEIKSASQLFGSWSFGGKGGSKFDSKRERWRDGYEALETQDINADGKIDGAELNSIALWFDHNRDAVSQPGEVISATKAGIIELYYKEPSEPQVDGSRHLNLGFRRRDGAGVLVSGASIDWTARSAEVGQTLFEGDLMRPGGSGGGLSVVQSAARSNDAGQQQEPKAVASEVSGYWRWINGIAANPSTGVLFLRANEDGSLWGSTVSEAVMMNNSTGDKVHVLRFVSLTGQLDSQDKSKVSFSMILPDNGQSARSSANLFEENGKTYLRGTTEASVTAADGSTRTVSYDWMAERITASNQR